MTPKLIFHLYFSSLFWRHLKENRGTLKVHLKKINYFQTKGPVETINNANVL